jgi:hypothetical protein
MTVLSGLIAPELPGRDAAVPHGQQTESSTDGYNLTKIGSLHQLVACGGGPAVARTCEKSDPNRFEIHAIMWILAADALIGRHMEAALSLGRRLAPLVVMFAIGISAPGSAQNLDAGKTPSQLFALNCQDCHRSPRGLAKNANSWSLSGFLQVHYTTSKREASALAAYVLSLAQEPAPRNSRRATTTSRPKVKSATTPADEKVTRPPAAIDSGPAETAKPAGEAPAIAAKPAGNGSSAKPAGGDNAAKTAPKADAAPAAKAAASAAAKPAAAEKPKESTATPASKSTPAEGSSAQ